MAKSDVATEAIRNRAKEQAVGSVAGHTLKEGEASASVCLRCENVSTTGCA